MLILGTKIAASPCEWCCKSFWVHFCIVRYKICWFHNIPHQNNFYELLCYYIKYMDFYMFFCWCAIQVYPNDCYEFSTSIRLKIVCSCSYDGNWPCWRFILPGILPLHLVHSWWTFKFKLFFFVSFFSFPLQDWHLTDLEGDWDNRSGRRLWRGNGGSVYTSYP